MVPERAVERAVINGRSAQDVSKSDWEQVNRELTGEPDTDPKEAVLASEPDSESRDRVPGHDTRIEKAEARTEQAENSEQGMRASELSYRRLFEAAKDGILILDVDTGRITDVNPFLVELLGSSHSEMVGKTVGELSPFKDIESNKVMLERLQKDGYVRYEDLPLETSDGRKIAVEFVSNVYPAGDKKVIQCNIRDITERKRAEAFSSQRHF